ncbi:hypothetical protein Prudu_017990, partial [Prunus dulcis]
MNVNALRAVKTSLSDPRKHLKNWNNGDPCKSHWTGVFCFNTTVRADGYLHLEDYYITRTVSDNPTAEHESLRKLLSGNKLSGSLPDELGYLSKLNILQ